MDAIISILLILVIVGILVHFLVLNKKDCPDIVCPKCTEKGCPECPDCPKCPEQSVIGGVFGFPVKPGNEITDFLLGIEEEFKPLIHGMICGILDKVLEVLPEDKNVKCSKLVKIIEKLKNSSRRLQRDNMYQEFTDRHRVFEIIQGKLDILYDKLYKRVCKTEDDMVNGKDAKRIIEDFKNSVCDGVKSINLPKRNAASAGRVIITQKAKVVTTTKPSGYKVTDYYTPDGCKGNVIAAGEVSPGTRMDALIKYNLPKGNTACCVEFENVNIREMKHSTGPNDSNLAKDFKIPGKKVIDLTKVIRKISRGRRQTRTLCANMLSIEATPLN